MSHEDISAVKKKSEDHEKRKVKKKRKRGLFWLVVLLLILLLALGGIGWGTGWFSGEGKSNSDNSGTADSTPDRAVTVDSQPEEDSSSEPERTPVKLKVSGSVYIYNDMVRTLEQLKTDFSVLDKSTVIIEVQDDNAVANAIQGIHDLLSELGLSYSDIQLNVTTTAPDSSSQAETTTTTTAPLV